MSVEDRLMMMGLLNGTLGTPTVPGYIATDLGGNESLYSSSSIAPLLVVSPLCTNVSVEVNGSLAEYVNCSSGATPFPAHPQPKYRLYEFIVNGFGITIVAILGIIGNVLSAVVLSRPQMRSSVTCLLLALAFCDSLLVFTSALIFGLFSLADFMGTLTTYRLVYHPLWVPYLYPISVTAQTASVYLTLAVTLERFVAVCHPLRARSVCTWRRARMCVLTVLLFAITYNLPRWWEVRTDQGFNIFYNMTMFENYMSPMRADPMYIKIYINWAYLVVMYMVPFSGLVIFNFLIYRQVRKANRERQVLSKIQRREMGLASMLLCVVVVFLMCNVLPLVNNILESFYGQSFDHLVQTSNFLVVFNSSVNFVIYCTCGERFRKLLLRICRDFLWCRYGIRGSRRSSLYRKSHLYRGQHGGDFEDVSLASVANNHTCITTTANGGGNGNGAVVIDLSKDRSDNIRLHNYRNKTIPVTRNNYHYPDHHQNGDGVVGGGVGTVGTTMTSTGNGGVAAAGQNGKYYRNNRRVSSPVGPNPS